MTREPSAPATNEHSIAEALELEVARRARKGAWIYPIIGTILVATTDLKTQHAAASWLFVAVFVATAWGRLSCAKRALERHSKAASRALTLAVALQGGSWGAFVATIFDWYPLGPLAWFALTLSAGFVSGGTSSLGIHRQLHQLFVASMAVPIIVGLFAAEGATLAVTIALTASVYCAFLLRDARQQVEAYAQLLRAQDELRVARDQARAADRAKSSFLAMMSHEIRTPMHAAVGSATMLLETQLDPEQRRYAHTIVHAGETLVGLINDILDLSRMQEQGISLELADFALHNALAETMQMFEPLAKRAGLEFDLRTHASAQRLVHGDKRRLQQIVVNLVGNAIKFTERGFVRLEASTEDSGDIVKLSLAVSDSGIGIAQEQLERIFQPFEQADFGVARKYGGSGLGLAICHRLAEAMNGHIHVSSTLGSGTQFKVELELKRAVDTSAGIEQVGSEFPPPLRLASQLRVLVVDDSALNRAVVKQMLERLGCEPTLCESGEAALERLKTEPFDIVLMDCQMRGLDGYATTRRLRALSNSLATVPVIAVTANAFEDDRKAALQSGMDDLLAKPFSLHDLERVLLRWTRTRGIRSTTPGPTSSRAPDPAARLVSSGMSMYPKALQNIALLLGVEVDGSSLDGPVSGFLGQWEQRHAMMRQAIEAGDTTTLRQVLHALEGGIPYFGSEKLNAALKELQRHSRAGDMVNAAQACQALAAHVSELTESRARHLAQTAPTRH